ncbi:phosphomannomutase [Nitrospira sp.]|nr:phosphomannomutase [Nitrospira sp.]
MGLFREYDIRGVVGEDLTSDAAERIGRAYSTAARARGARTVSVGRDGRLSSPDLHQSLVKGLMTGGLNVIDVGVCATPLVYFSLHHLPVDGGIMITGSHNAAEYNGFKLCIGKSALHGDGIQELKRTIESGQYSVGKGTLSEHPIIPDYLAYLKQQFVHVDGSRLRVVVDAGNGAASLLAGQAIAQLGCRVTELYCDLDGRFPNHHPDPTMPENLKDLIRKVRDTGAHVGMGYDGDADRIGAVDEKGNILWGDRLMVVYARDILETKPGSTIISEVKASQHLYDDIQKRGGRPIMWKTGHSLIKAKMKEEHAALAGEMSGHMFFADRYFGYDDAIYASCRLIEILAKRKKPLSSLVADLPPSCVTPEIRVDCPDAVKFDLVKQVQSKLVAAAEARQPLGPSGLTIRDVVTIDGIRTIFNDGWGLIRASNTQPALVLRFEASSEAQLKSIRAAIEGELEEARRALSLS